MQGEAIGEVAIGGLARRISMHASRRIAPERGERRGTIAGEARGVPVGGERRDGDA